LNIFHLKDKTNDYALRRIYFEYTF
jgi:hypothetical protein